VVAGLVLLVHVIVEVGVTLQEVTEVATVRGLVATEVVALEHVVEGIIDGTKLHIVLAAADCTRLQLVLIPEVN